MTTIDRLRYYDGEFLRAFDFGDEQIYHLEMRRRLNRYLHLYGIVRGLQLNEDIQAGIHNVSILPGLAIDAFGREIYVFVPYTLGDQDVQNARIPAGGGLYDVWLRYNKTAQTPPSAGYNNCNLANQYTRWLENFSVVLLPSPSNPFTPPAFTDNDTDDPAQDQVGVLLGTVNVNPASATAQFSNPVFHHRHFFGVIAQRIQTPPGYDATGSFVFANKQSPRNPPVSLLIEPNLFARENVIVGPDFDLTKTSSGVKISISPAATANPAGSMKLAGDLFAQGNIYTFLPDPVNPQWLGISAYVKQLVQQNLPEIVTGSTPVTVSTDGTAKYSGPFATDTTGITVATSRLTSVGSSVAIAYFSQFETIDRTDFDTLFGAASQLQLSIQNPPTAAFVGQNGKVNVTWLAGPASGGPPPTKCAIDNFTLSCVVICYP
jgi:hypothetical protein